MKTSFSLILLFSLSLGVATANSLPSEQRKNNKLVQAALEPVRLAIQQSSAVFYNDKDRRPFIYGTVVSDDGFILTKASELEEVEKFSVRVDKKNFVEAEVIGTDERWDLALVKVDASDLVPVTWAPSSEVAHGTWVVSNGATTRTYRRPRVGMISANKREIPGGHPAVLGVGLKNTDGGGVEITAVTEKSGAEKVGIKKGDIVIEADGGPIKDVDELKADLKKRVAGDIFEMKVKRGEEFLDFKVELMARHKLFGGVQNRNDSMSGEFSPRRTGFPMVLQHEITLSRRSVGGPLFDLEGRCIGMNIAMANRVENYAIPLENLLEELPKLEEMIETAN
ncbi:MAG: S1C family serine protease [Akkermansiaceae bacterium]